MKCLLLAVFLVGAFSCLAPVDDSDLTGDGGGINVPVMGGGTGGGPLGGGGGSGCGVMPQGMDCSDCLGGLSGPTCSAGRWVCPALRCVDAGLPPGAYSAWVADESPFVQGEQVFPDVCASRPQPGPLAQALGPFPRASTTTAGALLEIRNETGAAVTMYLANGNFGPMELTLGQSPLITQPYGGWWCGQDPGLHVDPSVSRAVQLDHGGAVTVGLGGVAASRAPSGCYQWAELPAGCYRVEFCTFPQGPFPWPAPRGACAKTVISLQSGTQTQSTVTLR